MQKLNCMVRKNRIFSFNDVKVVFFSTILAVNLHDLSYQKHGDWRHRALLLLPR